MALKKKFMDIMENISPVLLRKGQKSLTIRLSEKFLLFKMMKMMAQTIEDDPYLFFISSLKSYKVLGKILSGNIEEFYKDRNEFYFKNFFADKKLYKQVKEDIKWVYKRNKDIKVTITKKGIIIYDNYKENGFNVLLMTIHSGTWLPENIAKKQVISFEKRLKEEDIDTHKIYSDLVLQKGGIWIDNKFSRFGCDYNRSSLKAIYDNGSERWVKDLWNSELTKSERKTLLKGYAEFYFTLGQLINSYRFNIIFDAHSMRHAPGRANISFGTKYIPTFYMPIVRSMQRKLGKLGYEEVCLNKPFHGGYILQWLSKRFPDIFIFSMEVNKKLYMTSDRKKTVKKRLAKLQEDLVHIFDIEEEPDEKSSIQKTI